MSQPELMGSIDIENARDYWAELNTGMGSASTTNASVTDDSPKNPIGFIWPARIANPECELC